MLERARNWLKSGVRSHPNRTVRLGARQTLYNAQFDDHASTGDDCLIVNSSIGSYSYLGLRCTVASSRIGRFCSVASDVVIGSGSHPLGRNVSTHPAFHLRREPYWDFVDRDLFDEFGPTTVGNDVWIGTKAIVRDGVSIGHGAVIGAGSIVTRDLEPYGIYVGSPARLLRYRFNADEIAALLDLRWWDRDIGWIKANAAHFGDLDTLLKRTGPGEDRAGKAG